MPSAPPRLRTPLGSLWLLLILLLGLAGACSASTAAPAPTASAALSEEATYVLFLGTDRRPGEYLWRTDMIIVGVIDGDRLGLINIPRDLFVESRAWTGKINTFDYAAEHAFDPNGARAKRVEGAGPEYLAEVLEERLGIPRIDYYIRLHMDAAEDAVDAVGGIEVDLPGWDSATGLCPGTHLLDGADLLAYVRNRSQINDLDRGQRAMRVARAALDQLTRDVDLRGLLNLADVARDAYADGVETDIDRLGERASLAWSALRIDRAEIYQVALGGDELTGTSPYVHSNGRNYGWVWIADWDAARAKVDGLFDDVNRRAVSDVVHTEDGDGQDGVTATVLRSRADSAAECSLPEDGAAPSEDDGDAPAASLGH